MFSANLTSLRNQAGMSQQEMADKLKIARATYTKLEAGAKSPTLDQLKVICNVMQITLDTLTGSKPSRKNYVNKDINFTADSKTTSVPRQEVTEKVDSLREILIYILNEIGARPNIGQTALYKLLYFIDFDYYEKTGKSITGLQYIKNHYGPTPKQTFQNVITKMLDSKEIEMVKVKYFRQEQVKYLPTITPKFQHLTAEEVQHIDQVLQRLGDKNARQLSELSHRDLPWLATDDQQVIDYQLAMYRTPELSVEEPQDEF